MKLLFQNEETCVGGNEILLCSLFRKLRENGHALYLVCPQGSGHSLLSKNCEHIFEPVNDTRGYLEVLNQVHPDIVISSLGKVVSMAAACRAKHIPAVWLYLTSTINRESCGPIERLAPCLFDRIIVTSDFLLGLLKAPDWFKVSRFREGIDLQHFQRDPIQRTLVRRNLGISNDAYVIGYAARFAQGKRHKDLIHVFKSLSKQIPNCHLILAGRTDGEAGQVLLTDTWALVENLGLDNRVHTLSVSPPQIPAVLSALDVFAFPSEKEGLPLSVLEAMAMELPVIVADGGGSKEPLIKGECGKIVDVGDTVGFENAILHFYTQPHEAKRDGRKARKAMEEFYSLDGMVDEFTRLFESLC